MLDFDTDSISCFMYILHVQIKYKAITLCHWSLSYIFFNVYLVTAVPSELQETLPRYKMTSNPSGITKLSLLIVTLLHIAIFTSVWNFMNNSFNINILNDRMTVVFRWYLPNNLLNNDYQIQIDIKNKLDTSHFLIPMNLNCITIKYKFDKEHVHDFKYSGDLKTHI